MDSGFILTAQDSAATDLDDPVSAPDATGLLNNLVEIHHVAINQSAMSMRVASHSLSLLERWACDCLKFYQGHVSISAETLSKISQGGVGNSAEICRAQAHKHYKYYTWEAAAGWEAVCEITDNMLSNIPEQMSMMCHSFNLATGAPLPGLAGRRPSIAETAKASLPPE